MYIKNCHDLPFGDKIPEPGAGRGSHTNDHFLTDTTKDEKWLLLVGRPSLAASRWRAQRPAPPSSFHIKPQLNTLNFHVILNGALGSEGSRPLKKRDSSLGSE